MTDPSCPVCRTADVVCGKWTLLVIRDLAEDSQRFCELERSLEGISPRTLSLRLRALEEEGIVERRTYPEVPPRVERAMPEGAGPLVPLIEGIPPSGKIGLPAEDPAAACRTLPFHGEGGLLPGGAVGQAKPLPPQEPRR